MTDTVPTENNSGINIDDIALQIGETHIDKTDETAGKSTDGVAGDAMAVMASSEETQDDCLPPGGIEAYQDRHCGASFPLENWDPHQNRETWTGKLDFILSCIGYAVGLGNVWRFPYLCYRNGGGAFFVPYMIFLFLCGMPMVMLEICLGQFAGISPTSLFTNFCPLFQGLGWGMCILSCLVCIYYNVIICWTLFYLAVSFTTGAMPWKGCDNEWNSDFCVDANTTNVTDALKKMTASEEYWTYRVLGLSSGVEDMGIIQWELLLCLAAAWILVFVCLSKGVKSSGKVVYVTATFPYVVLTVLFIRGVMLPGASDGLKYYFTPDWSKLGELSVWIDAASQIFYSLGAAWGALLTMASYNQYHHHCVRDAILLPFINCFTSVFAGMVVFSVIGFISHNSGRPIDDVIAAGPGLVFVVYPEALTELPAAPFWSILFFIMILMIGVDSQFAMFETVTSAIIDTYPTTLRPKKIAFTAACCTVMFLLGIPMVMQGGIYVLTIFDHYSATFSLMFISMCECLLVSYNYGHKRFLLDIKLMTHHNLSMYYPIAWATFTPLCILSLLLVSLIKHTSVQYDDYVYPIFTSYVGWFIALVSFAPTVLFAVRNISTAKGSFSERVRACMRPTPGWGPARLANRITYQLSLMEEPSGQTHVQGVPNLPMSPLPQTPNTPSNA